MLSRSLPAVILAIVCGSLVTTASAVGDLQWLKNAPVRSFTDADWSLLKATAEDALNNAEDGQAVEWSNPDSKNHGSVTPVTTKTIDGRTCRDLLIRNYAGNLEGGGTYEYCQQPDGSWGVSRVTPPK